MEQKAKNHLSETHTKTMFYITYAAVFFTFPTVLFILSRLIMGAAWMNKYNVYVTAAGIGLAVCIAEIIARQVCGRVGK
jgi:bacteriorhodopsin